MTYDAWVEQQGIPGWVVLLALAIGIALTFAINGVFGKIAARAGDKASRSKLSGCFLFTMAAVLAVGASSAMVIGGYDTFGPPAQLRREYPEYAQRRIEDAAVRSEGYRNQREGRNGEAWYQCTLQCNAVAECQDLARNRAGHVSDSQGQTACNRAETRCIDECTSRYGSN